MSALAATAGRGPVFLLAYERSGTNLLRRMMGAHPAFDGPPPTHLLTWLTPYEAHYGDLAADEAFLALVEDALQVTQLPLQPWDVPLSADDAVADIPPGERSLPRLLGWMHAQHAAARGKPRWFCKDKKLVHFVYELAIAFPDARFVYLARDPRDVYASYRKAPGGPRHPHVFAAEWADDQERSLRAARGGVLHGRIAEVTYEALLAEPEATVRGLCDFLGEPFLAEMLGAEAGAGMATSNSYWQNLNREVLRNNSGKYRQVLTTGEIRIIEETAWGAMRLLGYAPDAAAAPRPSTPLRTLAARGVHWARARTERARGTADDLQARERRNRFRASMRARIAGRRTR